MKNGCVSVAGGVHPLKGHAFAVALRGEQAVDDFLIGIGRIVIHEDVHLFGRGWKAGKVKGGAADEDLALSFLGRLQAFLLEAAVDEVVDGVDGR